jgi:hypothetical protein
MIAKGLGMCAVVGLLGAGVSASYADQTGLDVLHDMRREGGRTCYTDHYHYGNSAGRPSRKAAQSAAIKSWSEFVDLEYGSDWARFSRAASKSVECTQPTGGWECHISARPCK